MQKVKRHARRIGITVVGSVVLIVGIITIPYPGPGWLIVFAGLAILATEFTWAQRILEFARQKYDNWQAWLKRQSPLVRVIFLLLTALVVVISIWLFNGYGILDNLLQLGQDWLHSPLTWR